MTWLWQLTAIATLVGCWTTPATPTATESPDDTAVKPAKPVDLKLGTFRIPVTERSRRGAGTIAMPGITRFRYDGTHVTLSLMTEKMWMWRRPDDTYRLDARWVGDELQYRPPFGTWTPLATFKAMRYELHDAETSWVFERVTAAMKDADDRKLDDERPPHDYSIKPMDPYRP